MDSISAMSLLQISPVFSPKVFGFNDANQLTPSLLLSPVQASAATGMMNTSLDPIG